MAEPIPGTTNPTVDLALAIPNDSDIATFLGITEYAKRGAKAMPPDKLFDFVEHIAIQNALVGVNCNIRFEIACAYIKQESLWVHRRDDGHQKYESYEQWYKEVRAMVTGQTERSIQDWLRNQRFLESANIPVVERAELLQDPSRVKSLMPLFEQDGLGNILGFATDRNPDLIENLRREIGDADGEIPLDELPGEAIRFGLSDLDETPARFTDRLLNEGKWRYQFVFADSAKGGGPRIEFTVWQSGTRRRHVYIAKFPRDTDFDMEAQKVLDRHRRE